MHHIEFIFKGVLLLFLALQLGGCGQTTPEIVVYVSVDRDVAKPVLEAFTRRTGITVRAAYDSEANKTTGLVNRLVAERAAPRADVFWSGEPTRTVELCRRGVLMPSAPIQIDLQGFDDPNGCWKSFAGRLRVLLIRRDRRPKGPLGLADLTKAVWRERACLANPHFGSTGAHFAALYAAWGEEGFRDWIRRLRANQAAMFSGNAQVKEAVMQGSCWLGLTDSDDAQAALAEHAPVDIVIPDQERGGGTFLIPSTVSFVQGAPHSREAKHLAEFLLSAQVEQSLARSRAGFLPLRHALPGPSVLPSRESLVAIEVPLQALATAYPKMLEVVEDEWRFP